MSPSSTAPVCAVCGQSLPAAGQECPACHASLAWQDVLQAAEFVRDRLLTLPEHVKRREGVFRVLRWR